MALPMPRGHVLQQCFVLGDRKGMLMMTRCLAASGPTF